MGATKIAVGTQIGTQPPLGTLRAFALFARLTRLESVMAVDHFQNIFPTAIWDEDFSWLAAQRRTPHEHFDYQVFLGYLASRVGKLRLGVGVTEPIRRHPVLIAQAMLTLSHMTRRAPILGIGAGDGVPPVRYAGRCHRTGRVSATYRLMVDDDNRSAGGRLEKW